MPMDKKYQERRKEIESFFETAELVTDSVEESISASGKYSLRKEVYSKGKNTWSYSRGVVSHVDSNRVIADVKRNYGMFWHEWCRHSNGFEYLLCGEDYQGYTVINLDKRITNSFFPKSAYEGHGFCWAKVYPSPNGNILAVEGCYWACPYELVLYDFSEPDVLPLKELSRTNDLGDSDGWISENTFVMSREVECRKSDGKPYNDLEEKEQDRLDSDANLVEYRIERLEVSWPPK
jgi:hypothetical protein